MRYLQNRLKRISSLPKAITFDLTVEISFSLVFWKLDIQIFPRTPRSTQSSLERHPNMRSKSELEKVKATDVSIRPGGHLRVIEPKPPQIEKKKKKPNFGHFGALFLVDSLSLSLFLFKFSRKYIQKPLIPFFSQQSRGSVLTLFFLSYVLGPWI